MKRITVLMMTMLLGVASLWAIPAYNKPVDVRQPDGTTVTLLMRGDEFQSFITTSDGYTVIKGNDGYYRYAEKDGDKLKASAFVAKNAEERTADELTFLAGTQKGIHAKMSAAGRRFKEQASKMYSPVYQHMQGDARRVQVPGTIFERIDYNKFNGLIVLVNWNDRKFLHENPQEFYQKLTSEKHYTDTTKTVYPYDVKGSVRDYFYDNSMGMFDPTFDVIEPITIDRSCEYPFPRDENGNIEEGFGNRMLDILTAVMTELDKQVDFNNYDLNNNGFIDMVYIIFAGYGSHKPGNNAKYLWPHTGDFSGYDLFPLFDGKKFCRYACSVEILDSESEASEHQYLDGIGTMCHEFSHVLGLADHYDTTYSEGTVTPDDYDVMALGSYYNQGLSPVGYNAFERRILGFADNSITTLEMPGDYQLEPLNTSNKAYLVNAAKDGEVFYLENRQQTGWDECLPGAGLLAWRADTSKPELFTENIANSTPGEECFQLLANEPILSLDLTGDTYPDWGKKGAAIDLFDITQTDDVITFTAGKDLYPTIIEDFEALPLTDADATGLAGKFCQWNLEKAKIVQTGNYGNGQHVVQIGNLGKLEFARYEKDIRTLHFKIQNSNVAEITCYMEKSDDGILWETMGRTVINESDYIFVSLKAIPAGKYNRLRVLSTNNSAAAYIDDIKVTLAKGSNSISTPAADKVQEGKGIWYTIDGRKLNGKPTKKGLYIFKQGRHSVLSVSP